MNEQETRNPQSLNEQLISAVSSWDGMQSPEAAQAQLDQLLAERRDRVPLVNGAKATAFRYFGSRRALLETLGGGYSTIDLYEPDEVLTGNDLNDLKEFIIDRLRDDFSWDDRDNKTEALEQKYQQLVQSQGESAAILWLLRMVCHAPEGEYGGLAENGQIGWRKLLNFLYDCGDYEWLAVNHAGGSSSKSYKFTPFVSLTAGGSIQQFSHFITVEFKFPSDATLGSSYMEKEVLTRELNSDDIVGVYLSREALDNKFAQSAPSESQLSRYRYLMRIFFDEYAYIVRGVDSQRLSPRYVEILDLLLKARENKTRIFSKYENNSSEILLKARATLTAISQGQAVNDDALKALKIYTVNDYSDPDYLQYERDKFRKEYLQEYKTLPTQLFVTPEVLENTAHRMMDN